MSCSDSPATTETWWVLERLVVGLAPVHVAGLFVDAADANEAVRLFRLGSVTPVVPSFKVAEEVLRLLGWAEDRISWASATSRGEVALPDKFEDLFPQFRHPVVLRSVPDP